MVDPEKYQQELSLYLSTVKAFVRSDIYPHTLECSFESLNDWSLFYSVDQVKDWFIAKRADAPMQVAEIPLKQACGWEVDPATGNIYHSSQDFFVIHGVRVVTTLREVKEWDQPMLTQVGYNGGILGIVRKRFQGIPHYLCEAKLEPGNYGKAQISPTLQATFANLKKVHTGRKPHFADIFENYENYPENVLLFNAWLAEDGGRLYLKRNRGMLIEVPEIAAIDLPNDSFIWLSLYQIKELLKEDAWINPHVRGILTHV